MLIIAIFSKKDIIRMAPQIKKFDFGKMKLSVKVKAELFL